MKSALYAQKESAVSSAPDDDDRSLQSFSSASYSVSEDGDLSDFSQSRTPSKSDGVKLANKETKFVLCSKFMAYLVLFLTALSAGIAAYYFTEEKEQDDPPKLCRQVFLPHSDEAYLAAICAGRDQFNELSPVLLEGSRLLGGAAMHALRVMSSHLPHLRCDQARTK